MWCLKRSSRAGNRTVSGTNVSQLQERPTGSLVLLVGPEAASIVAHLQNNKSSNTALMNVEQWLSHDYLTINGHSHHLSRRMKVEAVLEMAHHMAQEHEATYVYNMGAVDAHTAIKWAAKAKVPLKTVLAHSRFAQYLQSNKAFARNVKDLWPLHMVMDVHSDLSRFHSTMTRAGSNSSQDTHLRGLPFTLGQILGSHQRSAVPGLLNLYPSGSDFEEVEIPASGWYGWAPDKLGMKLVDKNGVQATEFQGLPDPYFHTEGERLDIFNGWLRDGVKLIGLSSYQEFPGAVTNPEEPGEALYKGPKQWTDPIKGWVHIFRDPTKMGIPAHIPKLFCPQSDFEDPVQFVPDTTKEKIYDFVYCCNSGPWNHHCRNWALGEQCVKLMADKYNLKGLLVGKKGGEGTHFEDFVYKNITTTGFLNGLAESFHQVRFMFCPNIHDASPRVVAQAMMCDVPVLMNEEILGGWHQITAESGMFFKNNVQDFERVFLQFQQKLASGAFRPREFWTSHFGPVTSGKKLYDFAHSL